jgi:hypothetical protein
MMTRKDYLQFANLLNTIHNGFPAEDFSINAKRFLVNNLCDIFENDNKNFDRQKFKEAVYK